MSAANTAVPAASAASSRRTSAGAPSAITMAAGWTANSLPSIRKSSLSSNAARCAISWLPRTWTRLGWMRLRWPTSAAASVLSRRSRVAPPAFPPSQASPSLSRLSSYSCATLICNMGLPGGDVLMERARVGVGRELAAQLAVAQHLRELRQDSKVLFGRLLGHQQHENEIDGLAVGGVEGHGLSEVHKSADRLLQALDPAVRNRDPLAQAGRAEALPGEQTVEYQTSRHALIVLEEEPRLLEHALLARHIQVQKDVGRGQKLRNKVHRGLCRIGRFRQPRTQKPCPAGRKGVEFYTEGLIRGGAVLERIVGMRTPAVFVSDDLAVELVRQSVDRGVQVRVVGGDVTSEEVLELEDAARRKHEFLRGDARYGRFVQAERVGDLAQHQRPHRDLAVLEKVPLPVDDRLRHAQNRFEPLLHVLDQPARFLQLMRELAAGLAAVVLKDLGVHAVDAQLRDGVGVEARHPDVLDLLDDDVGHDVTRLERRERRAGARVEALDQPLGRPQLVVPALQRLLEPREVAGREELEVPACDGKGEGAARRRLRKHEQLQLEALAAVSRAHPGGIEVLHMPEGDVQFLGIELQLLGHELRELLQRLREIAVVAERFDQERHQVAVARFELGQRELLEQMLAQVGGFCGDLEEIVLVGVVAAARARSRVPDPVDFGGAGVGGRGTLGARFLGLRLNGGGRLAVHADRRRLSLVIGVFALEQGIVRQELLELLIQFQRRELEQADRLLKLRRQRQVLRELQLQGLLHRERTRRGGSRLRRTKNGNGTCIADLACPYNRKFSPR